MSFNFSSDLQLQFIILLHLEPITNGVSLETQQGDKLGKVHLSSAIYIVKTYMDFKVII